MPPISRDLPVVAIVGRPNVGKSALFNCIVGRRISIVHEQSGVTRDRVAAPAHFAGRHVLLVDTGGLGVGVKEKRVSLFDGLIREQVAEIVAEANALIWVVDCRDGITPQDQEIAEFLRQAGRPLVIAANKADNSSMRGTVPAEFAGLGFEIVRPTSCTQHAGIGELLREVAEHVPRVAPPMDRRGGMKIAVVGRPNVGKSSIVNRILGADRVMVSEVAGTTRDAIDVPMNIRDGEEDVPLTLIDTAGLRRRRQVDSVVEFFSVSRARGAIRRSDVVLFVVDATDPGTAQDRRIARMINDERKPCVLLVNKWDLISHGMKERDLRELIRGRIPFMPHCPMQMVCAISGYNFSGIFDHLLTVRAQMQIMIPTGVFNQFLQDTMARTPPASSGGKRFKVFYGTMVGNPPPHFILFGNNRGACPANYLSFLENRIREAFFPEAGLPIWLEVRERRGRGSDSGGGARRAAAGVQRQAKAERRAHARHRERRKGWRKKK